MDKDVREMDPIVLKKHPADNDDDIAQVEVTLYPHTDKVPPSEADLDHERWLMDDDFKHVNPGAERFEVLSGRLRIEEDGEEYTLEEGEEMTLEPNTVHRHWNPDGEPARIIWERQPAYNMLGAIGNMYGLAQAGKTDDDGYPSTLQLAVVQDKYPNDAYLPQPPVAVQKALYAVLAPLGRLMGYEATHAPDELEADRAH